MPPPLRLPLIVALLLGSGWPLLQVHAQPAVTVTFFGNNNYQPQHVDWLKAQPGVNVVLFNLDDHRNMEKELAAGLSPGDPARSTAIAQERVKAIPPTRLEALFTGPMKAREWQVQRVPAVVFGEGRSVVYGVTDMRMALERWQAKGAPR
ncbi:MAG: DUF1525 domain-containing protein [Steroidobacteraceae bacterium]